jgi:hypothetical protein
MTAAEHLKALHERQATHHTVKAEHHDKMSDSHAALAALHKKRHAATMDGTHAEIASQHETHAGLHKAHAGHHRGEADFHRAQAAACAKAAATAFEKRGNEIVPDGISRVTPDAPTDGLRAVPRIGAAVPQKPTVPLDFEKAFAVENED